MAASTMSLRSARAAVVSPTGKSSRARVMVPKAALVTDVKVANARSPAAAAAAAASSTTTQRKAPLAGFELGWTRDNEVFLSRLSMLGFAGTAVGEYLSVTGAGPLAQLGYLSGLEQGQVGLFLAGLIGFNLLASVLPNSGTFNKAGAGSAAAEDGAVGPLQDPTITLLQPAKFFSVTNWGFTPQNELFAGRVSLLGWVAALLGEVVTGLGPVGQLSAETGIPTQSIFFGLAAWAAFMSLTAADKLAVKKGGKASKSKTTSGKTVGSTGSASA